MSFRFLLVTCVFFSFSLAANAQEVPVFSDYDTMRAELDAMMKGREVKAALLRFGGADEMSDEDLDQLQARVRQIFPTDFKRVDLVKKDMMENGWSQELYAYSIGLNYLFATVLLHDRGDTLVAISFKFNTDFDALISNF